VMHTSTASAAHEITASSNEHPVAAKSPDAASSPSRLQPAGECLTSWKEIAVYLHREVRTVQRWEKHEGLPIHRHRHRRANSVYAYKSEVNDWWNREARSIEVERVRTLSQPGPNEVATAQRVNAIPAEKGCRQTDPTSPGSLVECVLELRIVGLGSLAKGAGNSVSVLRVRIATPKDLRPGTGHTTRDAKVPCRSLSLAKPLGLDNSRLKALGIA